MKLSKTSWVILIVGILMVAFTSVGFARSQRMSERSQLNNELASVELKLGKLRLQEFAAKEEELKKRLSQALSQLAADKAVLSPPVGSIDASYTLFRIAKDSGVAITGISSSGLGSDNLEGIASAALPLTIMVTGDAPNLISFVIALNRNFKTGIVKSVAISIPKPSGGPPGEKPSANVQLVIYTYQGG